MIASLLRGELEPVLVLVAHGVHDLAARVAHGQVERAVPLVAPGRLIALVHAHEAAGEGVRLVGRVLHETLLAALNDLNLERGAGGERRQDERARERRGRDRPRPPTRHRDRPRVVRRLFPNLSARRASSLCPRDRPRPAVNSQRAARFLDSSTDPTIARCAGKNNRFRAASIQAKSHDPSPRRAHTHARRPCEGRRALRTS